MNMIRIWGGGRYETDGELAIYLVMIMSSDCVLILTHALLVSSLSRT